MLRVAASLMGYAIAANDGNVGIVRDVLFDDTAWKVRWLVVDTGTWLTSRKVLVHPAAVENVDYEREELSVMLSKRQIESSPSILQDQPVSLRMENTLYDYYGWDPFWGGRYFGDGAIASPLSAPPYFGMHAVDGGENLAVIDEESDPHLRSATAVNGYHILAVDGEIGHVENFLMDDASWAIRYLIVDTRNWWPGRHVLLSPFAVRRIAWSERQVVLDVIREQVKSSPPWDPIEAIDTYYEKRLHHHYGWPGYGW